jgi:RNA-directed DNA polymerase
MDAAGPQHSLGSATTLIMARTRQILNDNCPDWYSPKGYPHFDQPIRSPAQVQRLVADPTAVAMHAFLPFIHFSKPCRKYKRDVKRFVKKERPLLYASHTDSQIFRRYYLILAKEYERFLKSASFGDSVIAYRRFDTPKCNIHFANEAFGFIETYAPCVAMAFDVKDFFESLCHKRLKAKWKEVLQLSKLPPDHYAIFKAVSRYAYVDRDKLYNMFEITKKKLKTWKGPICTPSEFRSRIRGTESNEQLLKVNDRGCGVPQGSAISALLSNIYMIDVDRHMNSLASKYGGLYLRYSDDILLVCKPHNRELFQSELSRMMATMSLVIHDGPGKCSVASFTTQSNNELESDKPLQYLGFTFDGKYVRIRSQTFVRYLRRMRKAIWRERIEAMRESQSGGTPIVRRKLLYSRYSHLGTRNFISYAEKAGGLFKKNMIRGQIKRHWKHLHALLQVE